MSRCVFNLYYQERSYPEIASAAIFWYTDLWLHLNIVKPIKATTYTAHIQQQLTN